MKVIYKWAPAGLSVLYSALHTLLSIAALLMVSHSAFSENFAGDYSGSYTGADSGTWSAVITTSGTVSGTGHSNALGASFALTGQVTTSGALTMGSVTIGATFYGTINSTTGATSGTWSGGTESGNFSGTGIITPASTPTTTTTTPAPVTLTVDGPAILAWAEAQFPQYFRGAVVDGAYDIYAYRYYESTGNYIGIANGSVYLYGPISNGELLFVGTMASFICQVYPNCGVVTTTPSSRYATQGPMHELVKSWGYTGQPKAGNVIYYSHNADGTTGGLFQRTTDACSGLSEADGSVTYTSNGQAIKYNYEDTLAGTTAATTLARLHPFNTSTNLADSNRYIEFDSASGFRIVTDGSPLEQYCGGPSLYDSAGRFPLVGGGPPNESGTYIGRTDYPMQTRTPTTTPLPSYVKALTTCSALVNPLGQIFVTIGGVALPVFTTTDLNMDQPIIHTMFSDNPLIAPTTTYALEYRASGFGGIFTVYFAPLTYYDSASPAFAADWAIACVTTKQ